jgi:hypothetical protein
MNASSLRLVHLHLEPGEEAVLETVPMISVGGDEELFAHCEL